MPVCYKCSSELHDDNWQPSFKKRGQCLCKYCKNDNWNKTLNKKTNPARLFLNGKYIPKKDPRYKLFKPGNYKNITDAIFEQSAASTIKEGYVYAITNKAWPEWVKIGMAIDAEDRLSGYQTSSPHRDYVLEHSVFSNDRRKAEQEAHTKALKVAFDSNSEWFKLPIEQAINILDNLNEHGSGTTEETNTVTPQDKLQEQPVQSDLWPSS